MRIHVLEADLNSLQPWGSDVFVDEDRLWGHIIRIVGKGWDGFVVRDSAVTDCKFHVGRLRRIPPEARYILQSDSPDAGSEVRMATMALPSDRALIVSQHESVFPGWSTKGWHSSRMTVRRIGDAAFAHEFSKP